MTQEIDIHFDKINVVDVKIGIPSSDYHKFICSGGRLSDLIEDHRKMIEAAIIYSNKKSLDGLPGTIHFMSGFVERYGRIPSFDDKIQIVADNYFRIYNRDGVYYVRSEVDFNVL